ncbi:hypothetical protein IJM16_01495 [Candidatus Saccharibacteria bacterium]|nr:hypothetical protein [Candidatus Saccharibacteria bacterium]
MKRAILRKSCIVLALAVTLLLGCASLSGSTLAYLTASVSVTNQFTFEQLPLGNNRTDTLNYYYQGSNGTNGQIRDTGYRDVRVSYRVNEIICATSQNTNIAAPPNGFRLSYITVDGVRVNAGGCTLQPNRNNIAINVYFEPITYTISYDFNGYNESDITFTDLPLQTTYTVYDMIGVPYDAQTVADGTYSGWEQFFYCTIGGLFGGGDSIECSEDVPGASVNGNTLLGWEDQNNTLHTYANAAAGSSWATEINLSGNNTNVYSTLANRQTGNLALTARWEYEVAGPNNMNSLNNKMVAPDMVEPIAEEGTVIDVAENTVEQNDASEDEPIELPDDSEKITETLEDAKELEQIETGGTEGVENGDSATE